MSDDNDGEPANSNKEEFYRLCGTTPNPQLFTDVVFVDAQAMAASHPDTFEAPTPQELAALAVGDVVKVCDGNERFWTVIKERKDADIIVAAVDNKLVGGQAFDLGDLVQFKTCNIYAIHKAEETDKMGQMLAFFASMTGGNMPLALDLLEQFMSHNGDDNDDDDEENDENENKQNDD